MVFIHTLHLCIPLCECVMRYWRFVWRFAFEVAQHGRRREEGGCQHGGCEMQTKLKSVNLSHVVSSGTETEDRRRIRTRWRRRAEGDSGADVRAAVIKSDFVVECLIAHRVRAKVTTTLAPRPMCAPLGTLSVACHRRQLD